MVDLGVIISNDLKPSAQCLRTAARANRMLGIIKLAFKFPTVHMMTILYKCFVLPLLEYCTVAWCPYYVKDIEVLEKVQRRFTRILPDFRDLPYSARLSKYNLSSLFARRLHADLVYVFKIIRGFIDVDPNIFFDFDTDSRTRGHKYKLKSFCSRLDLRSHWFSSRIISNWNALPATAVEMPTVRSFKHAVWVHFAALGIS